MQKPELAIFDFDDTILHLRIDWSLVRADVLSLAAEEGVSIDQGQHLVHLANWLSKKPGLKPRVDGIFLKHESECVRRRSYDAFPEVISLLRDLSPTDVRLAIASGNHTQSISAILSQLGLLEGFDFICGRDKVEQNKPAPDQLLLILGELGTDRELAIFAGDSPNDEGAAKAAGIRYLKVDPAEAGDGVKALRKLLF